jgi:hypothetical protein
MTSIDTVNDLPPRVQYVASAAQTVFPYPFPIFQDADLVVYVDGVLKALDTDYTVDGEGDDTGGNITFVEAMDGDEIVTIYRDIAIDRDSDVSQDGPWSSVAYNDELDKIILILQQLKANFKRSLRIPIIAEVDDADIELDPASFAGMYLSFDADGTPVPAALSATTFTQDTIGQLLYPRTDAEIAGGALPVDFAKEPGDVCRYADNTTPGTTDMSAALAAASDQAANGGVPAFSSELVHIATETVVSGAFRQPRRSTFTSSSAVVFGLGAVDAIYPEWWGAVADSSTSGVGTDCEAAFDAALAAASQDGDSAVALHPISLAPGNYLVGNIVVYPALKIIGSGIHVTGLVAKTGLTGSFIVDNGSASKVELRDFVCYCNNRAGLTAGINLGNSTTQFGTEGYISDLWVRDLVAGAPGFTIRGNVGCAGRLIAQDTGGVRFIGTGGMLEQLVNMGPKGFDVSGTNYCTNLGDTRVGALHIEAPATNTIPLLISAKASIDTVTVSFTNGRTHSHVAEIGADATSYRIGVLFYYFQSSPTVTITNGNVKLADGTYIGGNATNGSHSGEGGYCGGMLTTGVLDGVKAQKFTSFKLRIVNTAGTIQHRIGCASDSSVAGTLHETINSASATLGNTPTGADASTAMATGLKIGSASTHAIHFDTGVQVQTDFAGSAEIVFNNTGVDYTLIPQVASVNINGVTRVRMAWFLQNSTTGANVAWATALNDASDTLDIVFTGYLR